MFHAKATRTYRLRENCTKTCTPPHLPSARAGTHTIERKLYYRGFRFSEQRRVSANLPRHERAYGEPDRRLPTLKAAFEDTCGKFCANLVNLRNVGLPKSISFFCHFVSWIFSWFFVRWHVYVFFSSGIWCFNLLFWYYSVKKNLPKLTKNTCQVGIFFVFCNVSVKTLFIDWPLAQTLRSVARQTLVLRAQDLW